MQYGGGADGKEVAEENENSSQETDIDEQK